MFHDRKLLRQQLELLAKQSKSALEDETPPLSDAMCKIYRELVIDRLLGIAIISAVVPNLLVSVLVHISGGTFDKS